MDNSDMGRLPDGTGPAPFGLSRDASQAEPLVPSAAAWWAGDNEEFFRIGPCGTREEALGEARGYFGEEATIHLIHAAIADWCAPGGDQVIDMMIDNSDDLFVEDGFPDMAGTKEAVAAAEAELDHLLATWLAKHRAIFPDPTSFGWIGEREILPASAMSAGTPETPQEAQGQRPASATGKAGDAPEQPA